MTRRRRPPEVRIPDDPAQLPDYLERRQADPVANGGQGWEQLELEDEAGQ